MRTKKTPEPIDHERLSRKTYLTIRETQAYLSFPSEGAVYQWARKAAIPKCHRGGTILFLRRDLDEAVQGIPSRRSLRSAS